MAVDAHLHLRTLKEVFLELAATHPTLYLSGVAGRRHPIALWADSMVDTSAQFYWCTSNGRISVRRVSEGHGYVEMEFLREWLPKPRRQDWRPT